jgi:hypothetical protein
MKGIALLQWEVNPIGSGSCLMAVYGIIDVEGSVLLPVTTLC